MFEVKMFEVRDRLTFIPVMAVRFTGADHTLLWRAGFSREYPAVQMVNFNKSKTEYDAYAWGDRTMTTAHSHVEKHWDDLASGAVIDVEFVLGETDHPKESEANR